MKRNKKEDILLNTDNDDISMLAEIQTDPDEVTAMEFNKEIPVMPLRNMVMFPSVVMPVTIGRPSTFLSLFILLFLAILILLVVCVCVCLYVCVCSCVCVCVCVCVL